MNKELKLLMQEHNISIDDIEKQLEEDLAYQLKIFSLKVG
jgi:hypothetical protein